MVCGNNHCLMAIILVLLTTLNFIVTDARITSLTATSAGERITETNAGCIVELTCVGRGSTAVWRIFGDREAIVTRDNIQVITPVPVEGTDGTIMGQLIFNTISTSNSGAFTCTIGSNTRTIRITVLSAVNIVPGNLVYDISDFDVGRSIPVLCVVETCLANIDVAVRRDTTVLNKTTVPNTRDNYQFNLEVTDSLQGEHHCHATFSFEGMDRTVSSVFFNITGTPNIPATTPSPTKKSCGASMASPLFTLLLFSMTLFLALLT